MSLADLRPALRTFILGGSAVSAAVGANRIFPVKLPQGEERPSLVLARVSGLGDHHMDGPSGLDRPRYQIDAWAKTLDLAAALADLTKERLDGYRGFMGDVNVKGCFFDSEREDFDVVAKLYRVSRDYFIWYDER